MSKLQFCRCSHTAKHHKASGRCRKGCECKAAAIKAARKTRARQHV